MRSLARGIANAVAGNWSGEYLPRSKEEAEYIAKCKVALIEARGGSVDEEVR